MIYRRQIHKIFFLSDCKQSMWQMIFNNFLFFREDTPPQLKKNKLYNKQYYVESARQETRTGYRDRMEKSFVFKHKA